MLGNRLCPACHPAANTTSTFGWTNAISTMNQTLSYSPEIDQNNGDVYENLQVELFNGSTEDTKIFKGLSSFTTVRSFRAVIAARLGTSPTNVQLMMFGEYMDDCEFCNSLATR
jgi:hypothetical protein